MGISIKKPSGYSTSPSGHIVVRRSPIGYSFDVGEFDFPLKGSLSLPSGQLLLIVHYIRLFYRDNVHLTPVEGEISPTRLTLYSKGTGETYKKTSIVLSKVIRK